MNLSDIIIYGQLEDVQHYVERTDNLNYLDEYGYTPLIEAIIIDDIKKVEVLLKAGVDVNQKDITKRSALHWAVNNNNLKISKLLLQHGADPNAYHIAGEPVLVKPILRNENELKYLLVENGADFTFAADYINVKLLGHRFELVGSVDIIDTKNIFTEVDYEGFYLEFCLDLIAYSLFQFRQNYAARSIVAWFPLIDKICHALHQARQLVQYDHYLAKMNRQHESISAIFSKDPMIIPISQEGHAITMVKCGDLLAICDRALDSEPKNAVPIYYMNKPYHLTKEFTHDLVYKKQTISTVHTILKQQLGLQQIALLPLPDQVIGNCSWANVEAIIPAFMFMTQLNDPKNTASKEDKLADSKELFHRWRNWDTNRSLQFMLQSFKHASAARKASIAAVLAGILFQRCSAENPEHVERAKRIIKVLKTKGYEYVLQSYIQFYVQNKLTKAGENLMRLLKIYELEEEL